MLKKYKQYFIAWGQSGHGFEVYHVSNSFLINGELCFYGEPDGETDTFMDAMLLIDKLPEEPAPLKEEEREKAMQSMGLEFVGYEQVLTEVEL